MSGQTYFIFPYKFEDILEKASDKRFCIQTDNTVKKMDDRRIEKHLSHTKQAIQEEYQMIMEEDRFSFIYYLIQKFSITSSVSGSNKLPNLKKILDMLNSYFYQLLKQINTQQNNQRSENMQELCTCFKMSLFLIFYCLQNSVIKKSKLNIDSNQGGLDINQKKSKKSNAFDTEYMEKQLIDLQGQCLELLCASLQDIDLGELWQRKQIDGEFFTYYLSTCLRLFESKQLIKDQTNRSNIFTVLNYVMKELKREEIKQLQLKMINLVYEDETLVAPIADYIRTISRQDSSFGIQFTQELLQLLVTYLQDKSNAQNEATIQKNSRQFFVILSEEIPKIFYNNLPIFLSLLESEAYVLRNTVYDVILNIMKKLLVDIDETDQSKQKTKENLINILIQRIKDKSAFCRSVVLAHLAECCELNIIPIDYLKIILKQAIGRTKDVGAIVRKRALYLIQKIVDYYQYIFGKNQKFLSVRDIQREIAMSKEQIELQDEKITNIEQKIQKITMQEEDVQIVINDKENGEQEQKQNQENAIDIEGEVQKILTPQKQIYESENGYLQQKEGESADDYLEKLFMYREECAKKIMSVKSKNEKLLEYASFIEVVDLLVPNLVQMLGSKNISDVLETIKLLTQFKKFNIQSAQKGMRKMLVLVFSSEKTIKDEVLNTYYSLYMDSRIFKPKKIAENLISLLKGANLTEEKSFEEMLLSIVENQDKHKKDISIDVFRECFEIFNQNFTRVYDMGEIDSLVTGENYDDQQRALEKQVLIQNLRSSLKIIRIGLKKKKKIVQTKQLLSLQNNLERFLKLKGKVDWIVVKEICYIIQLAKSEKNINIVLDMIKRLILLLINNHGTSNNDIYVAATEIIQLTFQTRNSPESLIRLLLKQTTAFMQENSSNKKEKEKKSKKQSVQKVQLENQELEEELNEIQEENQKDQEENQDSEEEEELEMEEQKELFENKLSQSLFLASNSCLRFLQHCDNIEDFLGKIRLEIDNKESKKQEKKKTTRSTRKDKIDNEDSEEEEDELDQVHGGTEADYDERVRELHKIQEGFIEDSQIFKFYKNMTQNIVQDFFLALQNNNLEGRNKNLDRVAVLSLINYMAVSYRFCKDNIDLLFQFIDTTSEFADRVDPVIKTNIMIGLGDLYRRFTNLLEPKLHKVYETLQDSNPLVRKTALMVITHLVLIDKLKIKAEVSNIAVLIEDDYVPIQNQVKLFFYEINKKDNKQIFNFLPDIIQNLSKPEVDEEIFTNFSKNVLSTVIKDNPNDAMVDKMIFRFEITNTTKEWRNISQTLTLFSYTEKSVKRLLEKFEVFRTKLKDEKILENFLQIVRKTKQFGAKTPELKVLIEEFESKVNNYKKETFDDVKYRKQKKEKKKKEPASNSKQQQKKKATRKQRYKEFDDDEEDDNMMDLEGDNEILFEKYTKQQPQYNRNTRKRDNRRVVIDDEDSDY